MSGRPDLEAIKAAAEPATIHSDTQGWLAGHLIEVIDYAATLERDLAELRQYHADYAERLRAIEWDEALTTPQCAWCLAVKADGHEDGCKFAALLAAG